MPQHMCSAPAAGTHHSPALNAHRDRRKASACLPALVNLAYRLCSWAPRAASCEVAAVISASPTLGLLHGMCFTSALLHVLLPCVLSERDPTTGTV